MRFQIYRTLLLGSICLLIANGVAWAESPYRMQGVVTDADTQQPVVDATVQVLITSERDSARRIRKSQTNEEGRYSIELPAGHGWAWTLLPPDGYCPVESNGTEVFATTHDRPIFTKDYQVRKGVPIGFAVRYPESIANPPKTYVSLSQQKGNKYIYGFCEIDDNGAGTVTLLRIIGKFKVGCGDANGTLVDPDGMTVDFEEGFDPRNVLSDVTKGDDGSTMVKDANGLTATLRGCGATVRDKQLTIAINVEAVRSENDSTQLRGRIVDVDANGVESAAVKVAFYVSNGASATSQITTATDDKGDFSVSVPKVTAGQKVGLVITRDGYGGVDTKPMDLGTAVNGVATVDTIKLNAGCSIRVRVVDPDGTPLHGAVVEPLNDYASRTRIARTGPNGECLLTDLAAGLMRVSAQFGTLGTSTKIPLDRGENELVILKLAPTATVPATDQPERPTALAAGTAAPEWTIAEWTDGKQRNVSDYRGQVVVLDFWGIWCGPCIHAIPAMKELHDRYKDRDVVFLGIHTAGTDMTLVKRLLKHKEWNVAVGLDVGEDIVTGETVLRYAIQGYPSVIIVDRNGTIAFNSGDVPKDREVFMREMESLAKSAGLPWPIDKDATEEVVAERMTRLQVVMFGRMIDAALKTKAD